MFRKSRYISHSALLLAASMLTACGGGGSSPPGNNPGSDTRPDPFTFADVANAGVGLIYASNSVSVSGINAPATISVQRGEMSIDGAAFTTEPATIKAGQTVRVRATAPDEPGKKLSAVLAIGEVTEAYELATGESEFAVDASFRSLSFTWSAPAGATRYRVLKNSGGVSGFTDISGDIDAGQPSFVVKDLPIHLQDWRATSYLLEACNENGCASQGTALLTNSLSISAIGRIKSSAPRAGAQFGGVIPENIRNAYIPQGEDSLTAALALSRDGNVIAIASDRRTSDGGNARPGSVEIYVREDATWNLAQVLASPVGENETDSMFGVALALSEDGSVLLVGDAYESGEASASVVYAYVRQEDGVWNMTQTLAASTISGDDFGTAVAMTPDAQFIVIGAPGYGSGAGAAEAFRRNPDGSWSQFQLIRDPSPSTAAQFGHALAMSADGLRLAIAAPNKTGATTFEGAVYFFERLSVENNFAQHSRINLPASGISPGAGLEFFGSSLAMNSAGDKLAIGATRPDHDGLVMLLHKTGVMWEQQGPLLDVDARGFGSSLSFSEQGEWLAIGATEQHDGFDGIDGDVADEAQSGSGGVYLFDLSNAEARLARLIKSPHSTRNDRFGYMVGLSGDGNTLVVSAPGDDTGTPGFATQPDVSDCDASEPQNCVADSGAVFIY